MTRILTGLVIMILVLGAFCSCYSRTIPANWPIPQFTLPPGSTIARSYGESKLDKQIWYIDFDNQQPYSAVEAHFEAQLKQLKYKAWRLNSGAETGLYVSDDGLITFSIEDRFIETDRYYIMVVKYSSSFGSSDSFEEIK